MATFLKYNIATKQDHFVKERHKAKVAFIQTLGKCDFSLKYGGMLHPEKLEHQS